MKRIATCIVTREAAKLHPWYSTLPGLEIWDNSAGEDQRVYGRYLAAHRSNAETIVTIDDDATCDVDELLRQYQPGEILVNMPQGFVNAYRETGIYLVGFGAVMPGDLFEHGNPFRRYLDKWPHDELFQRECDRIFTYLNRDIVRVVDIGHVDLPHASEPGRMWKEPRHEADLAEIRRRLRAL